MLRTYRRNFVVFTMAVIGAVLAAVFVFLGVYMHREARSELNNTMQQVLRPLDEPTGKFRRLGDDRGKPDGEPLPDGETRADGEEATDGEAPPDGERFGERPDGDKLFHDDGALADGEGIVTVFYTPSTGEISVQGDGGDLGEDVIAEAAKAVAESDEQSGTLDGYGLYYVKQEIGDSCKIALADTSYVKDRTAKSAIVLAVIYVAAMGALLILTVHLAKRAAKPMENAVEMERQFVADISHDLKTPITVILANNSILSANKDETVGSQSQWIESTSDAAHGMMELISRMLTLSALDAKDTPEELYPVDLSSVCEKTALQMESVAFDRGIALESDVAEGVTVNATKEYAERIVGALVENALKYEGAGGCVDLTLSVEKKRAALRVHNASSYIDEADIGHVFERFYRADRSRTETAGHGLGLPIVKRQVELIGASIAVESTRENGTTFTVVFALCETP